MKFLAEWPGLFHNGEKKEGEIIMIRTNIVTLTVIPAVAYRQKLTSGGSGIVIMRPEVKQPGIASISRTSGEAIVNSQTDQKKFPPEAFREAMALTAGMPYRNQKSVRVNEAMVAIPDEEVLEEKTELNEAAYQKLLERYTDKNGKLSYDLINKEFIQFAHSSPIVREMIGSHLKAEVIRNYIVTNRIRNICEDESLSDEEISLMADLLDEASPKGIFRQLDEDIRQQLKKAKTAQ